MSKVRISTTVDEELLARARAALVGEKDSVVVEKALSALVGEFRAAVIDAKIAASYDALPFDAPDDWGDLASWHDSLDTESRA